MKKFALLIAVIMVPVLLFAGKTEEQYLSQARQMFEMGKYKDSMVLYETVLEMNKESSAAFAGKGNCYVLMGKDDLAQREYNNAKRYDPTFKVPDLEKWIELEKRRGKNVEKYRKLYWEKFGKGMKGTIDGIPEDTNATEVSADSKNTKADIDKAMQEKEQWSVGGRAKMASLGEIKYVYADQSNAMDGAGQGIKAGLLFRKSSHFFSLQPVLAKYFDVTKYDDGRENYTEHMLFDINESWGEIGWPNTSFMNSIKPLYYNTNALSTTDGGSKISNTGNLFGGMYTAGFKPIPLFGMAGSIGYKYSPYEQNVIADATNITATELIWDVSAGIFIPYLFSQHDEMDITAQFGTYQPEPEFTNISNGNWLGLPNTMLYSYNLKVSQSKSAFSIDPTTLLILQSLASSLGVGLDPSTIKEETSSIIDTTGFDIKGNIHYMLGKGNFELFAFFDAPLNIEHKLSGTTKYTIDVIGIPTDIPDSEVKTDAVTIGSLRGYNMGSGFRANLKYVSPGFKYINGYREAYYLPGSPVSSLGATKEVFRYHGFVTGMNITPIEQISMPLEYQWDWNTIETPGTKTDVVSHIVRGGLEVKPVPAMALRGGLSYEFSRTDGSLVMNFPSGSEHNPFTNALGVHFGGGFNKPQFELNAGFTYKRYYTSPYDATGITLDYNYLMYGYLDLNIYI